MVFIMMRHKCTYTVHNIETIYVELCPIELERSARTRPIELEFLHVRVPLN